MCVSNVLVFVFMYYIIFLFSYYILESCLLSNKRQKVGGPKPKLKLSRVEKESGMGFGFDCLTNHLQTYLNMIYESSRRFCVTCPRLPCSDPPFPL